MLQSLVCALTQSSGDHLLQPLILRDPGVHMLTELPCVAQAKMMSLDNINRRASRMSSLLSPSRVPQPAQRPVPTPPSDDKVTFIALVNIRFQCV